MTWDDVMIDKIYHFTLKEQGYDGVSTASTMSAAPVPIQQMVTWLKKQKLSQAGKQTKKQQNSTGLRRYLPQWYTWLEMIYQRSIKIKKEQLRDKKGFLYSGIIVKLAVKEERYAKHIDQTFLCTPPTTKKKKIMHDKTYFNYAFEFSFKKM